MAKKSGKRKAAPGDVATNRQASYRYELLDRWECGIELLGSEVKSMREGGAQLKDAYAALEQGELWLHSMYVAPYRPAARENHEPERTRKLLLHRRELERLSAGRARRDSRSFRPGSTSAGRGPRSSSRWGAARRASTAGATSRSASSGVRSTARSRSGAERPAPQRSRRVEGPARE